MVGAKPTALKAMLARGVTAVALTEWLEGSPKAALRALADVGLRDGVDGDTLFGAIESTGPADES